MSKPRVIYWFRTDLRLHDSPALKAALDLDPEVLYPIWCWDSHYVYHARVGPNRWSFLLECQRDLSSSLTSLNPSSKLLVLREPALTLLPKLFKAWKISHLVFEKDTDAYGRERDARILSLAAGANVTVVVKSGRTLWDPDDLVRANGDGPTMSIAQLQAAGRKLGPVAEPLPAPGGLPPPGELGLPFEQERPEPSRDLNSGIRVGDEVSYASGIAGPGGDFAVPTLEECGLDAGAVTTPHRGGEGVALEALERLLGDEEFIAKFEKPKTSPAAFEPRSTCLTSAHLHFGALSCRYFYHRVEAIVEERRKKGKKGGGHSEPPTSLTGQLLFRDMYFAAQAALGWEFAQTYANPRVRFVPWHLPSKVDLGNGRVTGGYEVDDEGKEVWFRRWKEGRTGFPWIDAIMRQLRQEGWVHHLARHSVACFLTRGGCYISWERGAEVFEELLIDHEPACNAGNWQWLSCTAFFAQFYRCYSPVAFGKKWDDEGHFVRRYVPELKDMPKKYIYEPHKAPIADQKKAGVLIKGDGEEKERDGLRVYPKPMFDFNKQREICIQGMKTAYDVGLYGNDPKVMDGTWKELFHDAAEGPTEGKKGGPGGLMTFEDADGAEEVDHQHVESPRRSSKKGASSSSSPKSTRGHKREHSQSTLESSFGKKKSR